MKTRLRKPENPNMQSAERDETVERGFRRVCGRRRDPGVPVVSSVVQDDVGQPVSGRKESSSLVSYALVGFVQISQ